MGSIRDMIAPAYFSINTRVVWNVMQQDLQLLKNCIEQIQQDENLD